VALIMLVMDIYPVWRQHNRRTFERPYPTF